MNHKTNKQQDPLKDKNISAQEKRAIRKARNKRRRKISLIKKFIYLLALIALVLIILFGMGKLDFSFLEGGKTTSEDIYEQSAAEDETTEPFVQDEYAVVVEGQEIRYMGEVIEIDALSLMLEADANQNRVYKLIDKTASAVVFEEVETLLKSLQLQYEVKTDY